MGARTEPRTTHDVLVTKDRSKTVVAVVSGRLGVGHRADVRQLVHVLVEDLQTMREKSRSTPPVIVLGASDSVSMSIPSGIETILVGACDRSATGRRSKTTLRPQLRLAERT